MNSYRIKLFFEKRDFQLVTYDYYDLIKGFLYNKILKNKSEYHGEISLYSISPLFNESNSKRKEGLEFNKGAIMYMATPSLEVFKDLFLNVKNCINEEFGYGLFLRNVKYEKKNFENINELNTSTSPIFLGNDDKTGIERHVHITYEHGQKITTPILKRIFLTKTRKLGYNFNEKDFDISFDYNFKTPKTKRILLNGNSNIASKCNVIIKGNEDIIGLAYGLGIGKSTSCGFGFINNIK